MPLFQEQLLKMAMVCANFSGGEAEELRRAMGFKRSEQRMKEIEAAARGGQNMMPGVVRAINAKGTVGEICDVLRGVFGEYRAPLVY